MSHIRTALPALITVAASLGLAPTAAQAQASGGVQAPSAPLAGGSEYGVVTSPRETLRPVVEVLSVPSNATAGRPPRVALRIDEAGVRSVQVRVTVINTSTGRPVISVGMGWVPTGRTVTVGWPRGATLRPGSYQVTLAARDHTGGMLLRRAHSSGQASLRVRAPVRTPPAPVPPPGEPQAGVPTPAQSAAAGAIFPVSAVHSFGGPENRFGAPRGAGRIHQGQDVLTAEGSPVVAPLAGTILTTSYQAGGAGYYAVEHTGVGFDFMFAHCQAGSLAVVTGQAVAGGQALCRAGQTGSATAPHLHFEMWVGGWQASTGHPIDPLPYLQAWDHQGAGG